VTVTPPGYLNFKVDWPVFTKHLLPQIFEEKKIYGKPITSKEIKIFIEHTSVNPNKAMHIGHLRNAILGDTMARVLGWLGYSTEVCNYIDDTGLQVVDVVTALLYLDPPFFEEGGSDFGTIRPPRMQRFCKSWRLWSTVFPNPIPGSIMRERIPAFCAIILCFSRKSLTSFTTSV
jgi:hypothetical protein